MVCNNCGQNKGNRYMPQPTVVQQPSPDSAQPPPPVPLREAFTEMNQYSFDTLLAMKKDVEGRELSQFREGLKYMSDDLKALQVLTFIRIFNGEEFSPHGHNPKSCVWFLHHVLSFPEMEAVNARFPGLQSKIASLYEAQVKDRITIE